MWPILLSGTQNVLFLSRTIFPTTEALEGLEGFELKTGRMSCENNFGARRPTICGRAARRRLGGLSPAGNLPMIPNKAAVTHHVRPWRFELLSWPAQATPSSPGTQNVLSLSRSIFLTTVSCPQGVPADGMEGRGHGRTTALDPSLVTTTNQD